MLNNLGIQEVTSAPNNLYERGVISRLFPIDENNSSPETELKSITSIIKQALVIHGECIGLLKLMVEMVENENS
jgi:hypothetical protein